LSKILTPIDEIRIVIDNRNGKAQMVCSRNFPIPQVMAIFAKLSATLGDQMTAAIARDAVLQEKLGFTVEEKTEVPHGPAS
jgi:hypothetical protein